ncbi:MAG: 50S ribosomal protein L23 [bacterium]|nr:50S ribosomal protein L23 [bacterium]
MANKFLVKRPLITEKSTDLAKMSKYVFLVDDSATAPEVKKVVEQLYGVNVLKTNIINTKDKKRRLGTSVGIKPGYKKIIVTLKKGQKLDVVPQ